MPFVRTLSFEGDAMDIEVGWPVEDPFVSDGDVSPSTLPGGPTAVASYFGPYEQIGPAYEAIQSWCKEHGYEIVGPPWESYFTDPHEEPDAEKWRTDVHFPVKT
jgi:effector-binding domain-containing protein